MSPSETLEHHKTEILSLASQYGIREIKVFGSVARHEDRENSDIDLLVYPGRSLSLFDMGGFSAKVEALLGKKVDILTVNEVKERYREKVLREAVNL